MNLPLAWILKLVVSCGLLLKRFLNETRRVQSSWQLTLWKKLKLCQPKWASWFAVVYSVALEVLSTLKTNTELVLKFNWRFEKLTMRILINWWRSVDLEIKLESNLIFRRQSNCARKQKLTPLSLSKLRKVVLAQIWRLKLLQTTEMLSETTSCNTFLSSRTEWRLSKFLQIFLKTWNCLNNALTSTNLKFPGRKWQSGIYLD